jgi:2-hydroxychromene-2-carboxylate isomerase
MAAPLQFYFDFISPYGYFASLRIEDLAARYGRTVDWRPMLLGVAVMKVMGLKPLLETPLKGDYVRRDVLRYARRHGVRIGRDLGASMGNPLPPARAMYWIKKHQPEMAGPLARTLYHAFWVEGRELSTPQDLAQIAMPRVIDRDALVAGAASDEASALLRAAVNEGIKAGIFGSPTVVVDGEPFWGSDRLADVEEWLATGGW